MRAWMAFGWAPWAMASATAVCLRSWNLTPSSPTRFLAGVQWAPLKLDGWIGLPRLFGNASPSAPGFERFTELFVEHLGEERRDGDPSSSRLRLRRLADEAVFEEDELLGHQD